MIKAGRRERKETREKINALIDAQMRTEEAMAHLAHAQANTEEKLNAFITNTDEKLSALINTVDRIANERGNGK